MEFHAGHAVAQVDDGSVGGGDDRLPRALLVRQDDDTGPVGHGAVGRGGAVEIEQPRVLAAVEGAAPLLQHLRDHRGQGDALALQPCGHLLHAERVPGLKGPVLPGKPPADGPVHVDDVVGDLGDAPRRVDQDVPHQRPEKLPALVLRGCDRAQPGVRALQRHRRFDPGEGRLPPWPVVHRGQIQRLNLAVDAAVETAALLLPDPAAAHHLLQRRRRAEGLARLVVRQVLVGVFRDGQGHVQAGQIEQTEGGGAGPAQQGPGQFVDLLHAEPELEHELDRAEKPVRAQAVGDKVGGVLTVDDALAQQTIAPRGHRRGDGGIGVRRGDDLQELHVAGRVEEVRAQEETPEFRWRLLGDAADRQPRGVGGDDRPRPPEREQAREQRLLGRQVLDDRLDDPVGFRGAGQIIFQAARFDQAVEIGQEERSRIDLAQALMRFMCQVSQVEHHGGDPGVGQVGGDRPPHHPRAQNRGAAQPDALLDLRDGHHSSSSLARPQAAIQ